MWCKGSNVLDARRARKKPAGTSVSEYCASLPVYGIFFGLGEAVAPLPTLQQPFTYSYTIFQDDDEKKLLPPFWQKKDNKDTSYINQRTKEISRMPPPRSSSVNIAQLAEYVIAKARSFSDCQVSGEGSACNRFGAHQTYTTPKEATVKVAKAVGKGAFVVGKAGLKTLAWSAK